MFNDYALILQEEAVASLSDGHVQGKVAVCIVRDAVAEVHVVWPAEVSTLSEGLPVVPSRRGSETLLLDFEEEMEALQAVEEAVLAEGTRLNLGKPPTFMEVRPVLTAGLSVMFCEAGLDIKLSGLLLQKLRWRKGDQVAFAVSPDGGVGCIYCEEIGTALAESQTDQGHLEVSSYLALPSRLAGQVTDWETPEYWISAGRIYFDLGQFSVQEVVESEETRPSEIPMRTRSLLDASLVRGVAVGALAVTAAAVAARLFL
jgi:hypothetical protein